VGADLQRAQGTPAEHWKIGDQHPQIEIGKPHGQQPDQYEESLAWLASADAPITRRRGNLAGWQGLGNPASSLREFSAAA
jgi:hypothetical protein